MGMNKRWVIGLLICFIFIGNFIRYSQRAPKRKYADFRVYYATGERFLGGENIYSRPDPSITPFKYSPTFAMLFAPLSFVSKKTASLIFFSLNFLSVILICRLSISLIGPAALSFQQNILLHFLTLLFSSRFILLVWDSGQVNLIMMLLVLISLYLMERKRPLWSAGSLGLSVLFKYMPAVFVPYFFLRKKFGWCLLVFLSIVLLLVLPAMVVGPEQAFFLLKKWIPYITETSLDKSSWYDYKNQSIFSMGLRFLTQNSPYCHPLFKLNYNEGMAVSVSLALLIYGLTLIQKTESRYNRAIDYSLLFLCMALFNPNAWMTNFVTLIFVYFFLIQYLLEGHFKDKITAVLVLLSFVATSWLGETVVGEQWENLSEEMSCVTIGALILIVALLRLKYTRILAPVPPPRGSVAHGKA